MYDNAVYARSRLVSTYVRTFKDNKICFINDVYDDYDKNMIVANVVKIKADAPEIIPYSELNLKPFELGYINIKFTSIFSYRKPMREDWRQGHRAANTYIGPYYFSECLNSIQKCLDNDYPTYEKCLSIKRGSKAFSKHFSVYRDDGYNSVMFCDMYDVGKINSDNGQVKFNEKFNYLRPLLEEVMYA